MQGSMQRSMQGSMRKVQVQHGPPRTPRNQCGNTLDEDSAEPMLPNRVQADSTENTCESRRI